MERVSIAMATYNGEKFIDAQLSSIISQTLQPAEMVVCDDGSSDKTVEIVRRFAANAPFDVRIYQNPYNIGHAENFIKAALLCRAPYVAFCDQDDVWLPGKLDIGLRRILTDKSDISLHKAIITDSELNSIDVLSQGIYRDAVYGSLEIFPHHGLGWGMSIIFRRELLNLLDPRSRPRSPWTPGRLGHDIWVYLLAASIGRVSHINNELILYRQHGKNSSGIRKMNKTEKMKAFFRVPIHRYFGNIIYYSDAARCFRNIGSGNSPYNEAALVAAEKYDAFAELQSARLEFYRERSTRRKARMLISMINNFDISSLSVLKDVVLGILSLGCIVDRDI